MSSAAPKPLASAGDPSTPLVVLTTMPDAPQAHALAKTLLGAELAACVQVLPPMVSHFEWKGQLCEESECLVLIKTSRSAWGPLLSKLESCHPYDVPELLAVGAQEWSQAYGAWLHGQVAPPEGA